MKYFFLLLLLSGCASMDKEFAPYIHSFATIAAIHNRDVSTNIRIEYTDLTRPRAGDCLRGTHAYRTVIRIDRQIWEQLPILRREALMFHELGHCLLNLEHSDGPGIMQSTLITTYEYSAHRQQMIDELFSK